MAGLLGMGGYKNSTAGCQLRGLPITAQTDRGRKKKKKICVVRGKKKKRTWNAGLVNCLLDNWAKKKKTVHAVQETKGGRVEQNLFIQDGVLLRGGGRTSKGAGTPQDASGNASKDAKN